MSGVYFEKSHTNCFKFGYALRFILYEAEFSPQKKYVSYFRIPICDIYGKNVCVLSSSFFSSYLFSLLSRLIYIHRDTTNEKLRTCRHFNESYLFHNCFGSTSTLFLSCVHITACSYSDPESRELFFSFSFLHFPLFLLSFSQVRRSLKWRQRWVTATLSCEKLSFVILHASHCNTYREYPRVYTYRMYRCTKYERKNKRKKKKI